MGPVHRTDGLDPELAADLSNRRLRRLLSTHANQADAKRAGVHSMPIVAIP